MFNPFQFKPDIHLRRVEQLLREANMGRVEHEAAAEHHTALARMYAERAGRLERELHEGMPQLLRAPRQADHPVLVENEPPVPTAGQRPRLSSL